MQRDTDVVREPGTGFATAVDANGPPAGAQRLFFGAAGGAPGPAA